MTPRTRFVPPIDTGTVTSAPSIGGDGHQYAQVKLDATGLTVTSALLATAAHATSGSPVGSYLVGDRVVIQVLPTGSKFGAVVYGVIS